MTYEELSDQISHSVDDKTKELSIHTVYLEIHNHQ
jgi:hypothetical protein